MIAFLKSLLKDETYINLWRWAVQKTKGYRVMIFFVAILILTYLAIVTTNVPSWPVWTGLGTKTAWDLADLLLVPLVLALIAYFFNKRQKEQELEIAQQERENEQKIAQDRTQETALQNYLDKMTELILKEGLCDPKKNTQEARTIARARTLTALSSLNGNRKGEVIQFLYEAVLITTIDLNLADLEGANLISARLSGATLKGAYLGKANLYCADLNKANLSSAILVEAILEEASLEGADLTEADLKGVNLRGARLHGAKLLNANLKDANLSPTFEEHWRWEGPRGTDLSEANLGGANLVGANLSGAELYRTNLRSADLSGADLNNANLRETNLEGVKYDRSTKWPDGFDPEQAGAINIERIQTETTGITPPTASSSDEENFSTSETLWQESGASDQTQARS